MFCDMVGFTELANRVDPEVLQGTISRYEDACAVCITRFEGYVFQRLGDGIVAFFGYPLAHEGEAERAIQAGLAIIASLAAVDVPETGRLQVRIGIATGVVVVMSAERGAVGETMNLASRLQSIARPGSLVVSEPVRRLAGGTFYYEDLGDQMLKGFPQPTRAYRVKGVSQAESRFEAATQAGLTPLVGREHEISMLLERWCLVQDGEGQVVVLSGEPGIGKSRIMSEMLEKLDAVRVQVLRLQCSPFYINSALYPTIDNLERALKFGREESSTSKLDKLETLMVTHYRLPLTDVRFVAAVLSIACDERYGKLTLTPQKHKDETIRTLVDLTEAAARIQPTVVLFEDAHWADPTSLEVLDQLIDRVRNIPLLIVLTHRPEFHARWSEHGHVTALNLSKLTRAQSGAIVAKLTGDRELPRELLGQILAKTDGVPLYVEELTRSILESGELKTIGDRYAYIGTAHTLNVPATLRDSLMARLDRSPAAKEIAQIGAAIGRTFRYELIAAVAQKPTAELEGALEQLVGSGLAFRRGHVPEATYTFKHALVQDAAYDSLLKSARQKLNGQIATVLVRQFPDIVETEPERVAHHFTEAGLIAEAVAGWRQAGERAARRSTNIEAINHLRRGLELVDLLPAGDERNAPALALRMALGPLLVASKGNAAAEVESIYREAFDLCQTFGTDAERFSVAFGLRSLHLVRGEVATAHELGTQLLQSAELSRDQDLLLEAHLAFGNTCFIRGEFLSARTHFEECLVRYDSQRHYAHTALYGLDPGMFSLGRLIWTLWSLGYPDQARHKILALRALIEASPHPYSVAISLLHVAWGHFLRREPPAARDAAEAASCLCEEHHFPHLSGGAALCRGWAQIESGAHAAGLTEIELGLATCRATGAKLLMSCYTALQADAYGKFGRYDLGLEAVDEALQISRLNGESLFVAELYRLQGELMLGQSTGESCPQAEVCLEEAIDAARRQHAKAMELRAVTSLARLWQSQGKEKEAYALLAPVYDWFTEGFETKDLEEARALLEDLSNARLLER